MSLYNFLFGVNNETPILLGMLSLNMEYFSRFRDVELIANGTKIQVLTRTGGGNREDYKENWEKIRANQFYITDYDDDFDSTYAYIVFKVPEQYIETTKIMFNKEPLNIKDKFENEIKEMDNPNSEASKKADEIAKQLMNAIENPNSNGIIIM